MSVLNDDVMESLLSEVRTYLQITWKDEAMDNMLKSYIRTSAKRLEKIYGGDLNFTETSTTDTRAEDALAHELLISRVFYAREKAIDDFDSNYRGELLSLRNYGKVAQLLRRKEEADNA